MSKPQPLPFPNSLHISTVQPGLPDSKYELDFSLIWACFPSSCCYSGSRGSYIPGVIVSLLLAVVLSPLSLWSSLNGLLFLHSKKGDESDEELDDEAMMALDKNISALFAEQQKRIQAKKDEKDRMRKEKILRRDFKIKVRGMFGVKTSCLPSVLVVTCCMPWAT